jgi:protein-tyrosine phosphatase
VIDLHSHILRGLDDGARNLDESVAMARGAVADGIRAIAATPHVREDYPTSADQMEERVRELRAALAEEAVPLEVLPGGEIAVDELARLDQDELRQFGLAGNPAFLLLETPYIGWPLMFGDVVARLVAAGITPLIAHPERNDEVRDNPERLASLVRQGALAQVTAASVDGRLGQTIRRCAQHLLELELVHVLASDAHGPGVRAIGLSLARSQVGDPALGRWLTEDVPEAIVSGRAVPSGPPAARRSLFRRSRASGGTR